MRVLFDFASNQVEIVGTEADWLQFSEYLNSGCGSIELDCSGSALPYDGLAECLRIELTTSPLAYIAIIDNKWVRISGSLDSLRKIAVNASEMRHGDSDNHLHVDSLILPNAIRDDSTLMVWSRNP